MLEKAIISGVTHDTSEAKATVLSVPDQPGVAARLFRALADAGVNIDMIVQNVSAQGATDISFTLPKSDLPAAEPILEVLAKEIDAAGVVYDPDVGESLPRRRRHEEPPGRRGRHVRGPCRCRHQHRDHLDLDHSRLVRDPRRRRRARGAGRARAFSDVRRGAASMADAAASPSSAAPARSARSRSRLLRERGYETFASFASARSAGRSVGGLSRRGGDAGCARRRRHRRRTVLRRDLGLARARAACGARRRGRDRQVVRLSPRRRSAARRARGQRRPRARARRHRREPELLHDSADLRLEAAARGGGPRARARLYVSGRFRRRRAADGDVCAASRWKSTTSASTGRGRATRPRRSRRSAPRRRRSWSCPNCRSAPTRVRVPVLVGHAESVWIETEDALSPAQAEEILRGAAGRAGRRHADAARRHADGPGARRPHPRGPRSGTERARPVPRVRQPRQGRRAQRDPDRRADPCPSSRARPAAGSRSRRSRRTSSGPNTKRTAPPSAAPCVTCPTCRRYRDCRPSSTASIGS